MANAWTELDSDSGVWLHEYATPIGVKGYGRAHSQ